jgi:hypothetical protein
MAGLIESLVKDATKSFFGNDYLRDFQHASKVFRTNNYAYSPKFKFLFHVYFDINTSSISPSVLNFPADSNFGLAVKTAQLPKYTFDLQTMNQYNRKRIVQTKIKYDPINITFHDDNNNVIRKLWFAYYSYYYKDPTQIGNVLTSSANIPNQKYDLNNRNIYNPDISGDAEWGYLGESPNIETAPSAARIGTTKAPFFNSIKIYGFNQHNFVMYQLINPMIESFTHDTYDYAQGNGVMEHQMTLNYETVKYYEGAVDGRNPSKWVPKFGEAAHYDTTLSPIARPGSQASILGPGGLVSTAGGIMEDISSGNFLGALQKAGAAKQTFKNPQNILNIAKGEAMNIALGAVQNTPNRNNIFKFPTADSTVIRQTFPGITGYKSPKTPG